MNNKKFRGIFGIPVTPFNNDESIDYKSLEKVINFTVENGCNGIVMPVMASEYWCRQCNCYGTIQLTNKFQ